MRTRPRPEHQEAVARRLALLTAELDAARAAGGEQPWWDGHTRVAGEQPPLRLVPAPTEGREPGAGRWPGSAPPADGAAAPPAAADADAAVDGVVPVPVPGRHAARRSGVGVGRSWAARLPAVPLQPGHVAALALMVAAALALTCWWVVRSDPVVEAAPAAAAGPEAAPSPLVPTTPEAFGAAPTGAVGAEASGQASGEAATVTVDVTGKVRRPGIAVLEAGSRVVDALEAAGGARPGVDLAGLNLARVLVDGEQVVVGVAAVAAPAPAAAPGAVPGPEAGAPVATVSLNTATQAELEALPEVGPVTAQAILAWREEHGGFTSVQELLEVDGIGDATLAQIAPHVTL
ncbi:ComEA family DNA-binding protein [Nocardioides kribbensis]|uniref:ComEA family DNA-binding protein n=1 Tax=Nocardioides kribbensis TaxID=305517 RepID=A0ABV1NWJ2_9ACTN